MNETLLDDEIPAKFKNFETGEIRTDVMMQSYRDLEKKLSNAPSIPKTHENYCVNCDHGFFESDSDLNKTLHDKGFTNEQVQTVYDLAAEKMVPMVIEMAGDFQAEREVEKLIEHFGGAEQWQEISRQLLAFGQKNLPADVLDSLSSSFEGVLALLNMMQGGEPQISTKSTGDKSGEGDLQIMMRDPKYWRDRDPSFVAKVTEGFQRLYSSK
jgi:hypothetical protein